METQVSHSDRSIRPHLLISIAAFIIMLPPAIAGGIFNDSGYLNISWSSGFSDRLFSGDIYPRWLPDMSMGAGSPVFYFYAPLPFYILAPFHLVTNDSVAPVLGSSAILALSGNAFFVLGRHVANQSIALAMSVVYMIMPYHLLIDTLLRAAIGEQAAFVFLPLIFLSAYRLTDKGQWAVWLGLSYAGLLLSHLPSSLIAFPFVLGLCLRAAVVGGPISAFKRATAAATLSAGLSSAYVLPALSLQDIIRPEFWGAFSPVDNLLFGRKRDGATVPLEVIVVIEVLFAIVLLAAVIYTAPLKRTIRAIIPWALIASGAIVMTTPATEWLWVNLPFVERIQFPWRALTVFEVSLCVIVLIMVDALHHQRTSRIRKLSYGAALAVLAFQHYASSATWTPGPAAMLIAARADAAEYLPACGPTVPRSADATLAVVKKGVRNMGPNSIPVFYYPFLDVYSGGAHVPVRCDIRTGFIIADDDLNDPLHVEKSYVPIELAGYLISLTTFLGLVIAVVIRRSQRSQPARFSPHG